MAEKETKSCSKECEEMTDNEIIKALDVCAHFDVCFKECPLFDYKAGCIRKLTASALGIIKRYQSDVALVRHGNWFGTVCSVCGESISFYYDCNFCPNCGAKMDG